MFIELTDHLRCPAAHPESYLVLIPDRMAGRHVATGLLGCPICQAEYPIVDGVARMGEPPAAPAVTGEVPGPEALLAFLGIEGPGGYVALVGEAARVAPGLAALLPGVHLALVNPPGEVPAGEGWSALEAGRLPLKARSMRGVVLGAPAGDDPAWVAAGIGAVLPGLRAAGHGAPPAVEGFELLAAAGGWWVGRGGAGR